MKTNRDREKREAKEFVLVHGDLGLFLCLRTPAEGGLLRGLLPKLLWPKTSLAIAPELRTEKPRYDQDLKAGKR